MFPSDLAETRIAEEVGAWTGGRVILRGEPEVTMTPNLGVTVEDVIVLGMNGSEDGTATTIPSVRASLELVPFLLGRVEVSRLAFDRPRLHLAGNIAVATDPYVADAGAALGASSGQAGQQKRALVIRDGTIVYKNDGVSRTTVISAADLQLDPDTSTGAIALSGHFAWRGIPLRIDASLDDLGAALSGEGSRGEFTLAAAPEIVTSKTADDNGRARQDDGGLGRIDLGSSVRRIVEAVGLPGFIGPGFGPLTVTGRVAFGGDRVTLSDATFSLGQASVDGRLSIGLGDDPPLLRRLHAIDGGDLLSHIERLEQSDLATWLSMPVSSDWFAGLDIDFEASGDDFRLGDIEISETAMSISARGDEMGVEFTAAGPSVGRTELKLRIGQGWEPDRSGLSLSLSGRLEDGSVADFGRLIRFRQANPLIGVQKPPEGTAQAAIHLWADGASIGELIESLVGSAIVTAREGSIDGADIVSTLERLKDGNIGMVEDETPFIPVAGRTHFRKLNAQFEIGKGRVRTERVHISGDRFRIRFLGEVNLKDGDIRAKGSALLRASESDDEPLSRHVELPFGIGGTVREPVVAPGVPRIGDKADGAVAPDANVGHRFAHRLRPR